MSESALDSPARYDSIRRTILSKELLRHFYQRAYDEFARVLERSPAEGLALEIGSGAGFIKNVLPEVVTSDFLPYEGVDRQIDATKMDLPDRSLRALLLLDVFHHIPDVGAFLLEAQRCLAPGGRILIVDPYPGWVGRPVYRFLHHEPFEPRSPKWEFTSSGPLSSANTALPWIVFERDRARMEKNFPELKQVRFEIHSPFQYWLSGGLRFPSLIPRWACQAVYRIDDHLSRWVPKIGSFADIELVRR